MNNKGDSQGPQDQINTRSNGTIDLRGFLAGVLSGLTKLIVGHPFDTIKLRLQCSPRNFYAGPLDCLSKTLQREGFRALYKGASPPAFGWALSDALLMGSLHQYRTWLSQIQGLEPSQPLSLTSHAIAGAMAGWTVCTVVTPVETLKAKLQIQTSDPRTRLYTGPIDCAQKMIKQAGVASLYHALPATLLFRTSFAVMFSSYNFINDHLNQFATRHPNSPLAFNKPMAQFLAGGISAELFWLISLPFDAVKNRMMCDSVTNPRYPNWLSAARSIKSDGGVCAFYRGFVPTALRAFPTNAAALVVWEGSMRLMN
ncbi:hypothetical protein O181_047457 [Austropuccinia psidii MF-1]|uniref:Mitochondrial carrier n=1 Tax=Austropuccinia psidii MF-1 TaxID=1389203 RepID=A0A9Q3DT78_9BASI|nr:hypothetical protein [Austropuccinia psidii MF-1]